MEDESIFLAQKQNMITRGEYRFVIIWTACLLFVYAVGATFGAKLLLGYAAETQSIRESRIRALSSTPNAPIPGAPLSTKAVDVQVGGYIDRIGEFNLKESAWTADFHLWFEWTSDTMNPGEHFHLVNGQITNQQNLESSQSGGVHHAEYRVVARITKTFDALLYPFGEDGLLIQLEDSTQGAETVRYVADKSGSGIGPEAVPRSVRLSRFLVDTTIGNSRYGRVNSVDPGANREGRSQFLLGMIVVPDGAGLYQKMFQALFASVAVALIALYIKPSSIDCRFGLPVGGFFASVTNNVFVGSLLPHADRLTLIDMVNAVSLFTIFFILAQSVISLYIYDNMGRQRLSLLFDQVSFPVFLIGYVAINVALVLAASPT